MVNKKKSLSHYPHFFSLQAVFSTIYWLIFTFLFIIIGSKFIETDILGKIWQFTSRYRNFNQYFIGDIAEKQKILIYATFLLVTVIALNIFSLLFNRYLWQKDKYIENNYFYLHSKQIMITNSLIHFACSFLITFSFISAFTAILTSLFVTFNTWNWLPQKKFKSPRIEKYFSWKNLYVRKIFFYSIIIVFVFPLIVGRLQNLNEQALHDSPEGLAKIYQQMVNSSDTAKSFMELIANSNYSLFHWFILFWFAKNIFSERQKEFSDFWTRINQIEKVINNFKYYYYYQENWAVANKKSINLGDYNYLENNPNFLRKDYLENKLDIDDFSKKSQEIVKYIKFCEEKIQKPAQRNFLYYCLFNDFGSWDDCLWTRKLIEKTQTTSL